MKKPMHPAVVGVVIALALVVVGVIFVRAADSARPPALKPPPALMDQYKKQGMSMFPTTIPGKYSNSRSLFGASKDHSQGSK